MAIYNTAPFLSAAIKSLLNQNIGFEENIQLILVNDGSTDESEDICKIYVSLYPNNIVYITKEHEGTSSARNCGISHIQGEYVNFMDSDDLISSNMFSEVAAFFNCFDVDIVSVPIYRFDGRKGDHPLNYKYKNGTRIIDLNEDPDAIQLSISSAFVPVHIAKNIRFDTRLAFAEDAKVILNILGCKRKLGVISNCKYMYRLRTSGMPSALQEGPNNPKWYLDYIKYFCFETISSFRQTSGYVPRFIQHALMYDLQWRILDDHSQKALYMAALEEYRTLFHKCVQYIDDDIISVQRYIDTNQKLFLYYLKRKQILLRNAFGMSAFWEIAPMRSLPVEIKLHIDFIYIHKATLSIEGFFTYPSCKNWEFVPCFSVNDKIHPVKTISSNALKYQSKSCLGYEIESCQGFILELTLDSEIKQYKVIPFCSCGQEKILVTQWNFGPFSPINNVYVHNSYCQDHWQLSFNKNSLCIKRHGFLTNFWNEISFLNEILQVNNSEEPVILRTLYHLFISFKKKKIWLICDRINKADDNGEAFFEYIVNRDLNIHSYFLISKKSPDYKRLAKIGKVVPFFSFRHKLLFLLSDYIISAHADHYTMNPFLENKDEYRDLMNHQRFIFLQHGIIKDDLSGWLNRYNQNIAGFVTSTEKEYVSIVDGKYDYSQSSIWLTGLPRYDYLYSTPKRFITIMPTWRKYLLSNFSIETGLRKKKSNFTKSEYFKFYNQLLNNKELLVAAQEYGYTICFMPHPNMTPYLDHFSKYSNVRFFTVKERYRDVFAWSSLIITDYSSVAFDFAYLYKPVIYTQFDAETFFSGKHPYTKGYFDYSKDGFGEVETTIESTVARVIEYMQNDCQLKEQYKNRIDKFFTFHDTNSCQRILEKIKELDYE